MSANRNVCFLFNSSDCNYQFVYFWYLFVCHELEQLIPEVKRLLHLFLESNCFLLLDSLSDRFRYFFHLQQSLLLHVELVLVFLDSFFKHNTPFLHILLSAFLVANFYFVLELQLFYLPLPLFFHFLHIDFMLNFLIVDNSGEVSDRSLVDIIDCIQFLVLLRLGIRVSCNGSGQFLRLNTNLFGAFPPDLFDLGFEVRFCSFQVSILTH